MPIQSNRFKIYFLVTMLLLLLTNNTIKTSFAHTPTISVSPKLDPTKKSTPTTKNHSQDIKKWAIILYIAADNDLREPAIKKKT